MSKGYCMLSRELMDSEEYFSERFTRMQAYIDLCLLAAYKDRKFLKRGNVVELKAGQLARSEEELAERWKWSRNTVRRFLNEQQEVGNIEQHRSRLITIITVKFGINIEQQNKQQTPPISEQQFEQQIAQLQEEINIRDKEIEKIKKEDANASKKKCPETDLEQAFETFRRKYKKYGGSARGFETEFTNLTKKHKDWKEIIPMLDYALEEENKARQDALAKNEFFPQMKNLQTYINQRSWENYSDGWESYNPNAYHPQGLEYDDDFDAYRFYGGDPTYDLFDGYTNENRPDGARVVQQIFVYQWSALTRTWIKQ